MVTPSGTTDVMDRILQMWRFPQHLIKPIAMHHMSIGNIRQLAPSLVKPIGILALANRLAHALLLGASGNVAVYPTRGNPRIKGIDEPMRQLLNSGVTIH